MALEDDCLFFHGAGIINNNSGYVFFGPSNAGKTTVTEFSTNYSILGDDMVMLRKSNGKFHVYATPFNINMGDIKLTNTKKRIKKKTKDGKYLEVKEHKLRVGFYELWRDGKKIREGFFYSKKEFSEIVLNSVRDKYNLFVFAHNVSFDIRVGLDFNLLYENYDLIKLISDSQRFIMIFREKYGKYKRKIIFLDSMNFVRLPLAKIGKIFGIQKVKIDDFEKVDFQVLMHREQ